MYTALYRKYRPATFAQVIGQEGIVTALQNQVRTGRVAHSYIFTGTRGTGKTSCAKIFARAINCENPQDGEPCGECEICKGIQNGSIFDVAEIDAASNNGVDDVRELREETAYIPAACRYRVYIIDEVHMLSTSAFNALLKIMEEPPAHVVFILATTEVHKVPATILSRCQRFDFNRVAPHHIEKLLLEFAQEEGIVLEAAAAALLARLADGAVRDALSLLDTCIAAGSPVTEQTVEQVAGVVNKDYLFTMSDAIAAGELGEAFTVLHSLLTGALDVKRLLEELIYHYRNILLAGLGGEAADVLGVSASYFERYKGAAAAQPRTHTVRAVAALGDALAQMSKGADPRIQLELAVFALCQPESEITAPPAVQPGAATPRVEPPVHNIPAQMPKNPTPAQNLPVQPAQAPPQARPLAGNVADDAAPPPKAGGVPVTATEEKGETGANRPVQAKPPREVAGAQAALQNGSESAGMPQPFEQWQQVVQEVGKQDKLLHATLAKTEAYRQGRRVLIAGSDMFLDFMRSNEYSTAILKKAIELVSGEALSIGPYKAPAAKDTGAPAKEADGMARLKEMDVPIEYI
ncbi:DNA polymerase III subunit gamma/tau [Ruminococcaceae bacterium OttesenSCG-928-N02]|nr:DNA polymerase III subunit gamma/tau [Ruminococcaceae bacterium OttesenSCG-928-N02]